MKLVKFIEDTIKDNEANQKGTFIVVALEDKNLQHRIRFKYNYVIDWDKYDNKRSNHDVLNYMEIPSAISNVTNYLVCIKV